ncbi:MAG: rhodanese-like domain-containing protein [Bacteroidota bacterium]
MKTVLSNKLMNNRLILRTFISVTIMNVALISCDLKTSGNEVESVSTSQTLEMIKSENNVVVLDVRTPEEYSAGHISTAININIYDEDFANKVGKLDKDKTYIVHCAANVENGRSHKSIQIMKDLGFANLMSMEGGFAAWYKDGLQVESN